MCFLVFAKFLISLITTISESKHKCCLFMSWRKLNLYSASCRTGEAGVGLSRWADMIGPESVWGIRSKTSPSHICCWDQSTLIACALLMKPKTILNTLWETICHQFFASNYVSLEKQHLITLSLYIAVLLWSRVVGWLSDCLQEVNLLKQENGLFFHFSVFFY